MKTDKPILFQPALVRATLAGIKTQTRRLITSLPDAGDWRFKRMMKRSDSGKLFGQFAFDHPTEPAKSLFQYHQFPYGEVGGNLWARENFRVVSASPGYETHTEAGMDFEEGAARVFYPADRSEITHTGLGVRQDGVDEGRQAVRLCKGQTIPSIHMPRWASRIDLALIDVRAERVNQITEADALAEGFQRVFEGHILFDCGQPTEEVFATAREGFRVLWNRINGTPAPVYVKGTPKGQKKIISHYVAYPWEDGDRVEEYRGKPLHIHGNPFVWVLGFRPTFAKGGVHP